MHCAKGAFDFRWYHLGDRQTAVFCEALPSFASVYHLVLEILFLLSVFEYGSAFPHQLPQSLAVDSASGVVHHSELHGDAADRQEVLFLIVVCQMILELFETSSQCYVMPGFVHVVKQ